MSSKGWYIPTGEPVGRPSDYTEEIGIEICKQLTYPKSMRSICEQDGMPHIGTVFRWLDKHPEFRERYVRAREIQAHAAADMAFDESQKAIDRDSALAAKVRADGCRWHAARLLPKQYGDAANTTINNNLIVDDKARTAARAVLLAELNSLARPEPLLIEGDAVPVDAGGDEPLPPHQWP